MNVGTRLSPYYSINQSLLQNQQTWFNNHSGSCSFGSDRSYCRGGGFYAVYAYSSGDVVAYVSFGVGCGVDNYGDSNCGVSWGEGDGPE